jgi:hypothetical protein
MAEVSWKSFAPSAPAGEYATAQEPFDLTPVCLSYRTNSIPTEIRAGSNGLLIGREQFAKDVSLE